MKQGLVQASTASAGAPIGHPGSDKAAWAQQILAGWRATVDAVLNAGRLLLEAKAALPHGEFGAMCESDLPFSARTAQCLMAITRDHRLQRNLALLPPSWGTLYDITKLDDQQFERALSLNVIRPDTERWEIEGFRKRIGQAAPQDLPDPPWCPSLGSRDVRTWTVAQLRLNAARLQTLIDQAGAASEIASVGDVISDQKIKSVWSGQ